MCGVHVTEKRIQTVMSLSLPECGVTNRSLFWLVGPYNLRRDLVYVYNKRMDNVIAIQDNTDFQVQKDL